MLTPPIPNFTATPRSGMVPLTVVFNDTSTGGLPTLWYWTFGDGADAAGPNVTHTYTTPGNYTIVLEVANYDADVFETRVDYITVLPILAPIADFSGSPTSGNAPLSVQFTDLSTEGPTSWA
ncbi:MAG: PKD domain-containing protein [Methanoregula sp.]|jgi:PKD repeat protein|nr:PKD domain-containing protein [Methanoregula sp.]